MLRKIQLLRSKINHLNAQIAGYYDSCLFSPLEIATLSAPLVPRIQELQDELRQLQATENETDDVDALTPQKQSV